MTLQQELLPGEAAQQNCDAKQNEQERSTLVQGQLLLFVCSGGEQSNLQIVLPCNSHQLVVLISPSVRSCYFAHVKFTPPFRTPQPNALHNIFIIHQDTEVKFDKSW
jgi:hypothetical protein